MEGSPLQTGRGSCRSRKPGKGTPGSDPHLPGHRARLNSQPGSPGTHVLETAPDWAHSLGHLRLTNMFSCCVPVFRACRLRRASGRDASRPWRQWVRSCTGRLRSLARRDPKVTQGDPETSSPPRHRSDLTCAAPGPLPSVCVCVCVCVCVSVWKEGSCVEGPPEQVQADEGVRCLVGGSGSHSVKAGWEGQGVLGWPSCPCCASRAL